MRFAHQNEDCWCVERTLLQSTGVFFSHEEKFLNFHTAREAGILGRTNLGPRFRGGDRRTAALTLLFLMILAAVGCGFHLRGSGGNAVLPASLSTVRVATAGPAENEPLAEAVRQALRRAGAALTDAPDAPTLVLLGERIETRVTSVNPATAKATEYLLLYSAGFRLESPPVEAQTVRLQRDYSFDPAQALAREQQERELVSNLRQEAAQQIVRRLAGAVAPPR